MQDNKTYLGNLDLDVSVVKERQRTKNLHRGDAGLNDGLVGEYRGDVGLNDGD